jgi:hypothetical protein
VSDTLTLTASIDKVSASVLLANMLQDWLDAERQAGGSCFGCARAAGRQCGGGL